MSWPEVEGDVLEIFSYMHIQCNSLSDYKFKDFEFKVYDLSGISVTGQWGFLSGLMMIFLQSIIWLKMSFIVKVKCDDLHKRILVRFAPVEGKTDFSLFNTRRAQTPTIPIMQLNRDLDRLNGGYSCPKKACLKLCAPLWWS